MKDVGVSALERWLRFETELMHRGGDPLRVAPDTTNIKDEFLPDSQCASFTIGAYWVDAKWVQSFSKEPLGSVERYFFREFRGTTEVLFLVHPVSKMLYTDFLAQSGAYEAFPENGGLRVIPTASARTVLIWPQAWINEPFFAKLSVDGFIGEVDRKLTAEDLTRSIGVSRILHAASSDLPSNFKFLCETLAIAPKTSKGFGFLIRPVPDAVQTNDLGLIPCFSVYSRARGRTILEKLVNESGKNSVDFLTTCFLAPFAKQWAQLVVEEGFIPEPHAQNLLLEFDKQGKSTGVFVHRDLEGFFVDFEHRKNVGKPIPADLPMVTPLPKNYTQYRLFHRAFNSVYRYFQGTILYELNRFLPRMMECSGETVSFVRSDLEGIFVRELELALSAYTDRRVQLKGPRYKTNLTSAIKRARRDFF